MCSLPFVFDALLRPLADLPGVVSVHLIDPDGFVVQTNGQPAGTDEIERWQSLVQTADKEAMTTLVMEQGYLILAPVSLRTLAVKCQRQPTSVPSGGSSRTSNGPHEANGEPAVKD